MTSLIITELHLMRRSIDCLQLTEHIDNFEGTTNKVTKGRVRFVFLYLKVICELTIRQAHTSGSLSQVFEN